MIMFKGPSLRGDSRGPYEAHLYDEIWLYFERATIDLGDKLGISPGAAEAQLRKLCASGEIRTIANESEDEMPVPIPPRRWRDEDIDVTAWEVLVSTTDFYGWLNRQPTQPTAGGKQSRIARLLADMFPDGVPNRADCPREPLRATLLERDPSLKPLDLKTLKTAIEVYNRQLGNARNASVSD
jgi:hypothetical protein